MADSPSVLRKQSLGNDCWLGFGLGFFSLALSLLLLKPLSHLDLILHESTSVKDTKFLRVL